LHFKSQIKTTEKLNQLSLKIDSESVMGSYRRNFIVGNLIFFFYLFPVRANFAASCNDGARNDTYRARAGMLAHVCTAKEESLTNRSRNSSDSSLCDRHGVPGSREPITIRWRRGRSSSRRRR